MLGNEADECECRVTDAEGMKRKGAHGRPNNKVLSSHVVKMCIFAQKMLVKCDKRSKSKIKYYGDKKRYYVRPGQMETAAGP